MDLRGAREVPGFGVAVSIGFVVGVGIVAHRNPERPGAGVSGQGDAETTDRLSRGQHAPGTRFRGNIPPTIGPADQPTIETPPRPSPEAGGGSVRPDHRSSGPSRPLPSPPLKREGARVLWGPLPGPPLKWEGARVLWGPLPSPPLKREGARVLWGLLPNPPLKWEGVHEGQGFTLS